MKRYSDEDVKKARKLIVQKETDCSELSKLFNASGNTVSIWCRGLKRKKWNKLLESNEKLRRETIKSEEGLVKRVNFDEDSIKLYCSILYGCEGSKYPSSNGVAITNSDPKLILTFITLMRKAFNLKEDKWRVLMQVHSHQDYNNLLDYWSRILSIPKKQFFKPTVTKARGGRHREKYLGTCSLRYYDYKVQLKLIGIFNAFMRKSVYSKW